MNDLPGIDDVASGYDAAKMLSASEQNSKYRIFDLSEESSTPFKLRVLGKEQTFTRPRLANAVPINLRRGSTCETVSYTFESFFRR